MEIKNTQGNWFDDQEGIWQVITKGFQKRFKEDTSNNPLQAIPLSSDITDADNEFLTKEVPNNEILQVKKQMDPFEAPGPEGQRYRFPNKVQEDKAIRALLGITTWSMDWS